MQQHRCRFCNSVLSEVFVDLGMSPLSNAFVPADSAEQMEAFFPLTAYVCGECLLVQVPQFERPEKIFSDDYAYHSSYSDTWLEHARQYVEAMIRRYGIDQNSRVIEIASNDGYLLQYFVRAKVPVLGIEPAANVGRVAEEHGVPTVAAFFGSALAEDLVRSGQTADLLLGNNVLAHVPDLNDFVEGLRIALKPNGVVTLEFPHLVRLIEGNQFDTIYHEHFSYFSLSTVKHVFDVHHLQVFDVEEIPTHGGSLRVHVQHAGADRSVGQAVERLLADERQFGIGALTTYRRFGAEVQRTKRNLLRFLIEAKENGKRVAGYGAPAKANTLLNYCGIRADLLEFTVDRSPYKQGRLLPGTRIPVHDPKRILETKPDFVLILPWNIKEEITQQMNCIRDWGGRFVVPIPRLEVLG
jgi:SAM-dependent methyltransferase